MIILHNYFIITVLYDFPLYALGTQMYEAPRELKNRENERKNCIDTSFPKPWPYNIKRLGTRVEAGTHIGTVYEIDFGVIGWAKLDLICSSLGQFMFADEIM